MALLTDDRVTHLAELRLYTSGQGDPRLTRRPFNWYQPAAEAWAYGLSDRDSNGVPLLQWVDGLGITNRAFIVPQDTLSANWTTSGGSWAQERPGTGSPRKYRLVQYATTADLQFSATSSYALLNNPSFAWSLILPDTPPDHNATTYPPYARLEFGGVWALQVGKNAGAYLMRKVDGTWRAFAELPQAERAGYADVEEIVYLVRCQRGMIWVSPDYGNTWEGFGDGSITVSASSLVFRGQGGQMAFGIWQVQYAEGVLTSSQRSTFGDYSALTPTIDGRTELPTSTAIDFDDAGTAGYARYTATLTPYATAGGGPWDFYQAPTLFASRLRYTGASSTPLGTYTLPFDSAIKSIRLNKPFELDAATLTVTARNDPDSTFIWSPGRYPKAAFYLGHSDCDGGTNWGISPFFVGYIEPIEVGIETYRAPEVSFTLVSVAAKYKRAKWSPLDRIPLGGQTLNAALDDILLSEGLDTTFRLWHTLGDSFVLPQGSPEDPFEWPADGEPKWETMARLCGYAGLELGVSDDGVIYSRLRSVTSGVQHALSTDPSALTEPLSRLPEVARLRFDSAESVTAVMVSGELESGEQALAVYVDSEAEGNPISPRYSGLGRELEFEEVSGTCEAGVLALRTQAIASERFGLKFEPDLRLTLPNRDLSRRDTVFIDGLETIGIDPADEWVILTVEHDMEFLVGDSRTSIGLRRLES